MAVHLGERFLLKVWRDNIFFFSFPISSSFLFVMMSVLSAGVLRNFGLLSCYFFCRLFSPRPWKNKVWFEAYFSLEEAKLFLNQNYSLFIYLFIHSKILGTGSVPNTVQVFVKWVSHIQSLPSWNLHSIVKK